MHMIVYNSLFGDSTPISRAFILYCLLRVHEKIVSKDAGVFSIVFESESYLPLVHSDRPIKLKEFCLLDFQNSSLLVSVTESAKKFRVHCI